VVGGIGSGTDSYDIIVVSLSVLIGDGFEMFEDYLSSENEHFDMFALIILYVHILRCKNLFSL
jgi:hypothetical protein